MRSSSIVTVDIIETLIATRNMLMDYLQEIIYRVGDYVSLGLPLTEHRRNRHYSMKNPSLEYRGMYMIDGLSKWIRTLQSNEKTHTDSYVEL
jgi:hypothetical protein